MFEAALFFSLAVAVWLTLKFLAQLSNFTLDRFQLLLEYLTKLATFPSF